MEIIEQEEVHSLNTQEAEEIAVTRKEESLFSCSGGCDDEDDDGSTVGDYDFETDREDTVQALLAVRRDHRLHLYYDKPYLRTHEEFIVQFLNEHHEAGVNISLEPDLIPLLLSIDIDVVRTTLTTLFAKSGQFPRLPSPLHYFACRAETVDAPSKLQRLYTSKLTNKSQYKTMQKEQEKHEKHKKRRERTGHSLLCWIVTMDCDEQEKDDVPEQVIATYVMPRTDYSSMAELERSLDAHQDRVRKLKTAMTAFIQQRRLNETHPDHEARRSELCTVIATIYASRNISLHFNPDDHYELFQHLLTSNNRSARALLYDFIAHKTVKALSGTRSGPKKHDVTIGIKRHPITNSFLLKQLQYNTPIFVDPAPINEAVAVPSDRSEKTAAKKPNIVYVGETRYEGEVVSMHFVPHSGYELTERQLETQRELNPRKTNPNDDLMRESIKCSHTDVESEGARRFSGRYLKEEFLKKMPHLTVSPSVESFDCSERFASLWNPRVGSQGSEAVMMDFVAHTVDKTNRSGEERGWDQLDGDLSLNKTSFKAQEFDNRRQTLWSPEIKDIMADPKDAMMVADYQRQKLPRIDTVSVNIGSERLATSVLPCTVPTQYYQMAMFLTQNYTAITTTNNNSNNNSTNTTFNIGTINNGTRIICSSTEAQKLLDSALHTIGALVRTPALEARKALEAQFLDELEAPANKKQKIKKRKASRSSDDDDAGDDGDEESSNMDEEDGSDTKQKKKPKKKRKSPAVSTMAITCRWIDSPDLSLLQQCECCKSQKSLNHFFQKSTGKKETSSGYIRNMCHSCISRQSRAARKMRKLSEK